MGLKVRASRSSARVLTRDEINQLVEKRIREEIKPEEVRLDELFLKKFGLVDDDFDLVQQLTDVLTEQATALYDFKTRTMYLATWTPEDMQEFALVHELAHALADQHFDLGKFVKQAKGADEDLARSAVLEGQASWAMTEYVLRPAGPLDDRQPDGGDSGGVGLPHRSARISGLLQRAALHERVAAVPLHRRSVVPAGGR